MRLGDVVEQVIDNRGRNPESYSDDGIPVIDNVLIKSQGVVDLSMTRRFIDQNTYDTFLRKYSEPGDVLLTLVGNGYGQVAITPNETCAIIQNTIGLRCKEGFSNQYLYYLLKFNIDVLRNLDRGAAQPSIKVGDVLDLGFYFPNYAHQNTIGGILYTCDNKIHLNRQINQTLEQMAQALFKSWFIDFDPVVDNALDAGFFEQYSDLPEALLRRAEQRKIVRQRPDFTPLPAETRQLFPAAFEACEEPSLGLGGWVPQGWELGHLSDIAGYGSKRVDVLNLTVDNYISTENMLPDRKGVQPASNLPTLNSVPAYTTRYVLVSNIRPYFKKIWLASGDGGYSNDVLGFESKNAGDEHFLFNLLYQDVFFDFMMATSKGSKMPRGDKKTILSWGLVIPPLLLRKLFSTNVSHFYESMTHRNNECNTLSQLRDTLLPKLIAGELRLNDNAPAVGASNND
ncbi:restriction endonuclease subunit S [Edwardsiella ictaluri]